MSKKKLAKYFAPLFIGNPHTPIEDGLKKLQDLKEQQMVIMLFLETESTVLLLISIDLKKLI